jgi:hypothetical protein
VKYGGNKHVEGAGAPLVEAATGVVVVVVVLLAVVEVVPDDVAYAVVETEDGGTLTGTTNN